MTPAVASAFDATGAALLIASLATFLTAATGTYVAVRVRRDVRTYNETTAGALAAANETRRIEGIPHDDRTEKEQRHLDDAPPPGPPQGPAR